MPRKDAPNQKRIDWRRADQLAALRLARLPAVTLREGERSVIVPPKNLILVLRTIDDHGSPCWASAETLGAESGLSRRSVFRGLAALAGGGVPPLAILAVGKRRCGEKGWVNSYAIVWAELSAWIDRSATVPDRSATVPDRSATVAREASRQAPRRSAPSSDVPADDDARTFVPADEPAADDYSLTFLPAEELESVRSLANRLGAWVDCARSDNRELVLKLATLRHYGDLSADDWEDVLESFAAKRARRELPASPAGWIWSRLRQRLGPGVLERLLARCRVPAALAKPS